MVMRFVILALALTGFAACKPSGSCPDGSEPVGDHPPKGFEVICWKGKRHKHGLATYWNKNGNKIKEGEYREDRKHGKWIYGTIGASAVQAEMEYRNGKKHGKYTSLFNHKYRTEGEYIDDRKHGVWVYYNEETGKKMTRAQYDNGIVIKCLDDADAFQKCLSNEKDPFNSHPMLSFP